MIYHETSNWSINNGKHGLLLFAQSLEEMISSHSFDSYKVPALNFHYICYEILKVIDLIEEDVLDKGNLFPLIEEIKSLFNSDIIAQSILGNDFDSIFSYKNSKGEYERKPIKADSSKDLEAIIPLLKKGCTYVVEEFDRNDRYCKSLILEIKERIKNSNNSLDELKNIYNLTRTIASELINKGFSQDYIYECIETTFFNGANINSIDIIETFFDNFIENDKDYVIYLPIKSFKQKKALEEFGHFQFENNVEEMFDLKDEYILKYKCKGNDPYRARESVLDLVNFCLSVSHFIKHNKYDYNPLYSEVIDIQERKVYSIRRPEQAVFSGCGNCEYMKERDLLKTCFNINGNLFQVLQLHSSALKSKNTDNQLINLWTAVEVAIPVVRKDNLSRVNQIGNILSTVLSINYFDTLIGNFYNDIKVYSKDAIDKIINIEFDGEAEEKLVALITLDKYNLRRQEISDLLLNSAPLLACRLSIYEEKWKDTGSILSTYKSHATRISQQIMRIYRTRNMLVHDGSSMPYCDYVLQNLHYYIDTFVKLIYNYNVYGYKSTQAVIESISLKERQYLELLKTNPKIEEENVLKLIL